jgi:hypothetical protein
MFYEGLEAKKDLAYLLDLEFLVWWILSTLPLERQGLIAVVRWRNSYEFPIR